MVAVGYRRPMATGPRGIGEHLKAWRLRRRMSQLDLALEAQISTRHLSFLETGRSRPSREMVLNLAERLDVPLRERNVWLAAAGYAPIFGERPLDHPALAAARAAIDLVLAAHEPYPAAAVDRRWNLVSANLAVRLLLGGVARRLLQPPVNVLRLALHPEGLAPHILNLGEWRTHLLARLRRQIELTADAALIDLLRELEGYPAPRGSRHAVDDRAAAEVVLPLRLETEHGLLSLFGTITVFGTPVDVTVAELALECFYPADPATAEILRRATAGRHAAAPAPIFSF
jgi:transcriptional regulator with XRE-family HTH domain